MRKILILLVLLLPITYAARIHGTIYDISLDRVNNVIVEVDSTPVQRFVAHNGSYSFVLSAGDYVISTSVLEDNFLLRASENISIIDDGDYVFDLFLFPDYPEEDIEDIEIPDIDYEAPGPSMILVFALFLCAATLVIFSIRLTMMKKRLDHIKLGHELVKIMVILEKNHGRATQKTIRKSLPYSEAKISLMITELEALGMVRRIKSGRSNVVIKVK